VSPSQKSTILGSPETQLLMTLTVIENTDARCGKNLDILKIEAGGT
jgi:hypothetical protein